MNIHFIDLTGYYAKSRGSSAIYLGTAGSHGNEQLQVTQGKGWEGLTVQVVFHPSKVAVQLPPHGLLDIPWEATAQSLTAMQGRIVFQGFDQDRLVNSTDLAYTVASHSAAVGRDEEPYTPGIVEGVLNQMAADKDAILQAAQQTGQANKAANVSATDAAGSAANAKQSAGAANTSAGQAAASANQAAASAATAEETLTQVKTAGQEAQQKVKDAETEALDRIVAAAPALPAVSTDAVWQSVTVKPDGSGYNLAVLAPIEVAIHPTVSGNPAVCENSAAWGLQGLKIYGKSVQNGIPSPENPAPIVSVGENGSIELTTTGKNLLDQSKLMIQAYNIKYGDATNNIRYLLKANVDYTLSVPDNISAPNGLYIISGETNGYLVTAYGIQSVSYTPSKDTLAYFNSYWSNGRPENATVLQLEISSVATSYEPYTGQSLILSTSNGLLGIPVTSGGNYTDKTGRQWISDVIDLGSMQRTQNILHLYFKGANNEAWILQSINKYGICNFQISIENIQEYGIIKRAICNRFSQQNTSIADTKEHGFLVSGSSLYVRIETQIVSDVESFKIWLSANPIEFLIPLVRPITNSLSAEEITAYRSLTTYAGTTVVSTAEPVSGLEVQYIMDGNKYRESVDKRLAALEQTQKIE